MLATQGTVINFLNGTDKKFIIPVYQRNYSWKKSDCILLFNDLKSVMENDRPSHFFGSLVYVDNEKNGVHEFLIIDGQQRITTVSLLLVALRNFLIDKKEAYKKINYKKISTYLTDEYSDDEKKLKLKLTDQDDKAYDKLIYNSIPVENSLITSNYNYFRDEIEKLSISGEEKLISFYNAIKKLETVNVCLIPKNGDDPQLIFESLNSTGQRLLECDKVRNYVLMNLDSKNQKRLYKRYWEPLEDLVTRDDLDKFIRYYLSVKNHELANDKNIYYAFKLYAQKIDNTESLLNDMCVYAAFYDEIKNAGSKNKIYSNVLKRINKLQINMTIPIMLDLFMAQKSGEISMENLKECFYVLESYLVRRIICNLTTNALNKLFVGLTQEIEKYMNNDNVKYIDAFKYAILSKSGKSRFPNNHELEEKFSFYEIYNAKPYVKKYMLERLEDYCNKESDVESRMDDGSLTIEHLMPQTLTPEWKNALGKDWELIYTKYIDTIGNITLSAYNREWSNKPFIIKKTMPSDPPKGLDNSKLYLNEYPRQVSAWGENEIKERAKLLLQRALLIWRYPSTTYSTKEKLDIICWDDDDYDFTDKKITKITLLGEDIATSGMTDAYKKINQKIYDLDPITYLKFSKVSNSKDTFINFYKLSDNVYINTKLSNQAKVSCIQNILKGFEFDSKDLIFSIYNSVDE